MLVSFDEMPVRDLKLASTLARIHAAAFAETGRAWSGPEILALLREPVVDLRLAHGECAAPACLAPAGFVLFRAVAGEAELLTLSVLPDARRRGMGRALLAASEMGAREAGARKLFLEVGAANAAARGLYADAGYREIGRREAYYQRPDGSRDDALVLEKAL